MEYSDLLGTQFVYGGRARARGLDCWGLVIEVYRRLGIGVEDVDAYNAVLATDANPVFDTQRTAAWHVVVEPFEPYDVLLFAAGCCGNAATHCAVYIGNGHMLHAVEKKGVIVTRLARFRKRLMGAYRHEAMLCHA